MMSLTLPVWDPAALAAALRERGLPGQRSKTAITRLRRERRARKPAGGRLLTPQDRLHARLVSLYSGEISRRGGETGIQVSPKTWQPLRVTDRSRGLCVLHAEGWRYYSRRSWHAALSYLCGGDEGGPWAVRVPGTITTVTGALDAITPAAARHAAAAGKAMLRQGDLYALETTAAHDTPTGWVGGTLLGRGDPHPHLAPCRRPGRPAAADPLARAVRAVHAAGLQRAAGPLGG
jgi:hypothetical protein